MISDTWSTLTRPREKGTRVVGGAELRPCAGSGQKECSKVTSSLGKEKGLRYRVGEEPSGFRPHVKWRLGELDTRPLSFLCYHSSWMSTSLIHWGVASIPTAPLRQSYWRSQWPPSYSWPGTFVLTCRVYAGALEAADSRPLFLTHLQMLSGSKGYWKTLKCTPNWI